MSRRARVRLAEHRPNGAASAAALALRYSTVVCFTRHEGSRWDYVPEEDACHAELLLAVTSCQGFLQIGSLLISHTNAWKENDKPNRAAHRLICAFA